MLSTIGLEIPSFITLALTTGFILGSTVPGHFVPLDFIKEPIDTVARRNEPIALSCLVRGSPSPTKIIWEKDGQPIDTDTDRRISLASNGTLLISKIIQRKDFKPDVGEYQCFVTSRASRLVSRKVHLDVAGKTRWKALFSLQIDLPLWFLSVFNVTDCIISSRIFLAWL